MPAAEAETHAAAKSGDLVLLEYDLWAEGGGRSELIDTTHEDVARSAHLSSVEGVAFGPRPHLVGDGFPSGIEQALSGARVGEEFEREFAPADAFGERDPKLIELFSMHEIERLPEMRREDAHLDVGTILTIRGRRGRVVTRTAARVRVDFNPPFSGRKIRGTFKVHRVLTDPVERARALVDLSYGRAEEFEIEVHDHAVTLKVPDRSKFDVAWFATKPRLIERLRSQLKAQTVRLVEEYATPAGKDSSASPKKEPKAKPAASESAPSGPALETPEPASPPPQPRPSSPPARAKSGASD